MEVQLKKEKYELIEKFKAHTYRNKLEDQSAKQEFFDKMRLSPLKSK